MLNLIDIEISKFLNMPGSWRHTTRKASYGRPYFKNRKRGSSL